MPCWKSRNLHVMLPERCKLPSARCVMEDIRSQPATSVSLYQEIWSSLNCQITFTSQIRTKAVWLKLEGHKWGIYSLFHLCRGLNNYSCIPCIHVHFWQASKGCFEKNNPLLHPHQHQHLYNKLPYKSPPAHSATLHWISLQTEPRWMTEVELSRISLVRLCDQSAWRQAVSKMGPEVKPCFGLWAGMRGTRYRSLYLVPLIP